MRSSSTKMRRRKIIHSFPAHPAVPAPAAPAMSGRSFPGWDMLHRQKHQSASAACRSQWRSVSFFPDGARSRCVCSISISPAVSSMHPPGAPQLPQLPQQFPHPLIILPPFVFLHDNSFPRKSQITAKFTNVNILQTPCVCGSAVLE